MSNISMRRSAGRLVGVAALLVVLMGGGAVTSAQAVPARQSAPSSLNITANLMPTCSNRAFQVSHAGISYVSWSYNGDYTSIGGGRYTWTFTGWVYQNTIVNFKVVSQSLGTVKHRCTS